MKKWVLLLLAYVAASGSTGCYWRPGYYMNGGGYSPYYAQPAYPQQQQQQQPCVPCQPCTPAPCTCY